MKKLLTILVIVVSLSATLFVSGQTIGDLRKEVMADQRVSKEIKDAIARGAVIVGMCPKEAFAAAGFPGPYMVIADKAKWPAHTPPPEVVNAQCEHPDESIIELMFRNTTQFGGKEPVVFRVRFEKGRAVLIDQNGFTK